MSQLLLSDLTALSNESKRRSPEVKAAADAALASLRADFEGTLSKSRQFVGSSAIGQPSSDVYGRRGSQSKQPIPSSTAQLEQNILLRPIVLACEPKTHLKITGLAVALLQRVVNMKAIPDDSISPIVGLLSPLLAKADVELLLKLLQTFSALLLSYPSIHRELLSSILHLCFRLQDSKVQVVSSTAAATVRQAVMIVFEKVAEEDRILDGIKEGGEDAAVAAPLAALTVEIPGAKEDATLFPSSADAFNVLSDLNGLVQDEPAKFLKLNSLPRTFTLELIESILTNHASLVSSHPELLLTLRTSTCPMLIRALSEKPNFPVTLRFMRLLFVLLRQFSEHLVVEVEVLMNILIRSAAGGGSDSKTASPPWLRIIALEVTRSLCSEATFLRNLWVWYDGTESSGKVFSNLVTGLRDIAKDSVSSGIVAGPSGSASGARPSVDRTSTGFGLYEAAAGMANAVLSAASSSESAAAARTLSQTSAPAIQFIDQLEKADAPGAPTTYPYLLASQSLVHLAQSLAQQVLPVYSQFVNARSKELSGLAPPRLQIDSLTSKDQRQDIQTFKAMASMASEPLRSAFFLLLSASTDDAIFCELLTAVRNWTNMCGVLGLDEARDSCIASLSRLTGGSSISQEGEQASADSFSPPSERSLAALRILTHITIYLSGILNDRWLPVLAAVCEADFLIRRAVTRRSSVQGRDSNTTSADSTVSSTSTVRHSVAPAAFQPGFSLATSPLDAKTGRPQLLAGLDYDSMLKEIGRCFANSTTLDNNAFRAFIGALCSLSSTTAQDRNETASRSERKSESSTARLQRGGTKATVVVLANIGLVTRLNVERLAKQAPQQGWSSLVDELVRVASQADLPTELRLDAAQILSSLLFESMGIASSNDSLTSEDAAGLQSRVFGPLAALSIMQRRFSPSDVDVRKVGTEVLGKTIQTHGHSLHLGWETIFEILIAACQRPEGDATIAQQPALTSLVKSAFASLQLVCNDHLAALTIAQLHLSVDALRNYAMTEDINIALTASSSLWGVGAELANRSPSDGSTASEEVTAIWLQFLLAFRTIATDERPDVRNAAISELYKVVSVYALVLDAEAWSKMLRDVLFGMLDHLTTTAAQRKVDSQRQEAAPPSTAKTRRSSSTAGLPVQPSLPLIAHQWEDSCVLAFQQLGGVVSRFLLTRLLPSSDFSTLWAELLAKVKAAFLSGPASISQASMRSFEAILQTDISKETTSQGSLEEAWALAWQTWASIGDAIGSAPTTFSQANLLAYVETFKHVYKLQPEPIELEAVPRLQQAVLYTAGNEVISDVDALTPVQAAVREAILSLKTVPALPAKLLTHLSECISLPFTMPTSGVKNTQPSYVAMHKTAVQDAVELYCNKWQSESEIYTSGALDRLFAALLVPIKLRYDCPAPSRRQQSTDVRPLWQEATLAFCRIVRSTCGYLRESGTTLEDKNVESLWRHFLAVFQASLEADCSPLTQLEPGHASRADDQAYDLLLLSTFETQAWPLLGEQRVPSALIQHFAKSLSKASCLFERDDTAPAAGSVAEAAATPREILAFQCLDLLFLLASDSSASPSSDGGNVERHRVAALVLPILLNRISICIQAYVADSLLRGGEPFPRLRDAELFKTLTHTLDLRLRPDTLSAALSVDPTKAVQKLHQSSPSSPSDIDLKTLSRKGPRAHLFALHRDFCSLLALSSSNASLSTTSPPSCQVLSPPEVARKIPSAPSGFQYEGRIGKGNVLGSQRLDRDEPKRLQDLARSCLDVVSEAFAL